MAHHSMSDTNTAIADLAADMLAHIVTTLHAARDANPDISVTATAIVLFDLLANEIEAMGYPLKELFETFAGVAFLRDGHVVWRDGPTQRGGAGQTGGTHE